jgi:hypothetical protein
MLGLGKIILIWSALQLLHWYVRVDYAGLNFELLLGVNDFAVADCIMEQVYDWAEHNI